MTLIKDLIEIPDHVEKGQFVLRLAEGVTRPEETLNEYVVTPELKVCYFGWLAAEPEATPQTHRLRPWGFPTVSPSHPSVFPIMGYNESRWSSARCLQNHLSR